MSDDTSSGYASARATLRETVKWLVAAFASIAAVIVAGSPLSSPDHVDIANVYFISSVVLAIVALGLVGRALHITLDLLRPDGLYSSALCRETPGESREIADARSEINRHRDDLLPAGYGTAEELWNQRLTTIRALDGKLTAEQEAEFTAHLVEVEAALGRLLDFGLYHTLYARLGRAQPRLFALGLLVLICLTLSVALGKSAKEEKVDGPSVVFVQPPPSQPIPKAPPTVTPPRLEPVQFESGSAIVSADGLLKVEKARTLLRDHPEFILLLAAHTDTMAQDKLNADLASQRGKAIRSHLVNHGGVEGRRVFVSELPESALPRLTGDEVREQRNRIVELLVGQVAAGTAKP